MHSQLAENIFQWKLRWSAQSPLPQHIRYIMQCIWLWKRDQPEYSCQICAWTLWNSCLPLNWFYFTYSVLTLFQMTEYITEADGSCFFKTVTQPMVEPCIPGIVLPQHRMWACVSVRACVRAWGGGGGGSTWEQSVMGKRLCEQRKTFVLIKYTVPRLLVL